MHFPLFVELEGRPCLVVGGGRIASRKAAVLLGYGARVTVVAPVVCETLPEGALVVQRQFEAADADGCALVVSATDDAETNRQVATACRARNVPVNVVDDPANCTFVFPAIVRKGPLVVAVSTGGASPVAAKLVRDKAAALLDDGLVAEVVRLGETREELKRRFPDVQERRRHCEEILKKWKD